MSRMGGRFPIFGFLALFVLLVPGAIHAACQGDDGLTFLHFNDLHGQLEPYLDPRDQTQRGGVARLAGAVREVRRETGERAVVLLFGGDLLQGTLTSSLFQGLPDVALLGAMGVDAAVMGNHELDWGQEAFRRLAAAAPFPFLSANVASDPDPLPVLPWVLLERPGMPRVAVLGLTTPELTTAIHPRMALGFSVEDPLRVAARLIPLLREQADLVVVLSHLGVSDDRRLARSVAGIDLIVGGHDHHRFDQPLMEGDVPIVQAGERGGWLGRMDFDCQGSALVRGQYALMPILAKTPEEPAITAKVEALTLEAAREMDQPIGVAARDLSAERELIRRFEAPFGNLVADWAREWTLAEVALFNAGGFRASIPAGVVTLKEVVEAFPFRNELVVGRLSGEQLRAALARSAAFDPMGNPGGFLQVSGVHYEILGRRLGEVTVGGRALDPEREYSVVTTDFLFAGGDGYDMLGAMREPVMTGRLLSDMVVEGFRGGEAVEAEVGGRIVRR